MGSQSSDSPIPTVDVSAFLSPTATEAERHQVVENVRHACTTYGFFTLVGHGISPDQLSQAFESSKLFFALPEEKRKQVHVGKAVGRSFRGWEPPFIQQHKGDLLPDTKEVRDNSSLRSNIFLIPISC